MRFLVETISGKAFLQEQAVGDHKVGVYQGPRTRNQQVNKVRTELFGAIFDQVTGVRPQYFDRGSDALQYLCPDNNVGAMIVSLKGSTMWDSERLSAMQLTQRAHDLGVPVLLTSEVPQQELLGQDYPGVRGILEESPQVLIDFATIWLSRLGMPGVRVVPGPATVTDINVYR